MRLGFRGSDSIPWTRYTPGSHRIEKLFPRYPVAQTTIEHRVQFEFVPRNLERWGAGVEYHFQEIQWALRPVVNGT